jgi:integrase
VPRKVRDANLETRTARGRLKTRHKPYFRLIEPGLHLGYRKLSTGPGTWVVRRYAGDGAYRVENLRTPDGEICLADDYSDPDGGRVLSFAEAQQRARAQRAGAKVNGQSYTVGDALDGYFAFLETDGRSKHSVYDAKRRAEAFIRPSLGTAKLLSLTSERLRQWRNDLAQAAPRIRTRKGEEQKYRELPEADANAQRARQSSANRTWTILRAALNHAFNENKTESDAAWRKVKPFKNVDAARPRYLSLAEAKRLVNACEPEFRPLVQAALQTGARYSELARLKAGDFNSDVGTIGIQHSKSGKPRSVVLNDEGRQLFATLTAGRSGNEPMFSKQWAPSHQLRPMTQAVARAKIAPAISFHGLRHTWASHAMMNGVPLMVVARNLGHVDTRMVEKHYGHLAPSYVADAIRKGAPTFGFHASKKVVAISAKAKR